MIIRGQLAPPAQDKGDCMARRNGIIRGRLIRDENRAESKFMRKFSQMLDKPYILHVNELGESPEGVIQLPLYMTQQFVTANT